MGFPIPGDAIEQRLDLNQLVVKNTAATFFMRVEGTHRLGTEVQPGDMVVVDRSLDAQDNSLVVAAVDGQLAVRRMEQLKVQGQSQKEQMYDNGVSFEVWGVVTTIIRSV